MFEHVPTKGTAHGTGDLDVDPKNVATFVNEYLSSVRRLFVLQIVKNLSN